MKRGLLTNSVMISATFAVIASCSRADFGSGGAIGMSESKSKVTSAPKEEYAPLAPTSPSSADGSADNTLGNSDGNSGITTDQGQIKLNNPIDRRFQNFLVSGNGPGSCGLNPSCGLGAPICPANYKEIGAVGDCFDDGKTHRCMGNRRLCASIGDSTEKNIVTVDMRIYAGRACRDGYTRTGNSGYDYVLGVATSGSDYFEYSVCRKTIARSDVKTGTMIVTDLKVLGAGYHYASGPNCPTNYTRINVFNDCAHGPGSNANDAYCHGLVSDCIKKEAAL
jgi:hypothetical protein